MAGKSLINVFDKRAKVLNGHRFSSSFSPFVQCQLGSPKPVWNTLVFDGLMPSMSLAFTPIFSLKAGSVACQWVVHPHVGHE